MRIDVTRDGVTDTSEVASVPLAPPPSPRPLPISRRDMGRADNTGWTNRCRLYCGHVQRSGSPVTVIHTSVSSSFSDSSDNGEKERVGGGGEGGGES